MFSILNSHSVGHAAVTADFNNDGVDDFVVGDRNARVPGSTSGGHVAIIQRDGNGELASLAPAASGSRIARECQARPKPAICLAIRCRLNTTAQEIVTEEMT